MLVVTHIKSEISAVGRKGLADNRVSVGRKEVVCKKRRGMSPEVE